MGRNESSSRRKFLKNSSLAAVSVSFLQSSCKEGLVIPKEYESEDSFEFAFLTDIHIKPEMNAPKGFQMAIDKVNELNPDFVLTGGDLVYDAMRGDYKKCESLFTLYKKMSEGFKMPCIIV